MIRRDFLRATMITCGATLLPALTHSKGKKTLPNVLIIGDSISIGYTKFVQEMMAGKANVHRPLNAKGGFLNCQGTTFGVEKIDEWLGDTKWDVIHFNFGLHDLKLAVETMRTMHREYGVVINRDGIGNDEVLNYCQNEEIPVLARIPNDRRIAELYSSGKLVFRDVPEVQGQLERIRKFLLEKISRK